jgi:hypothetical protein
MSITNSIKALGARAVMSKQDIRWCLKQDHDQFKEWTKTMAEGERTDQRSRAFARLKPSLVAHARTEEKVAYDSLIQSATEKETDTLGHEGYVEHHLADHLVERLSVLDPSTDEWIAHAKVLHELLGHHIQEEETDIFAKLGDQFSREELDAMGVRFQREKANFVPGKTAAKKQPSAARKTTVTAHAATRAAPAKATKRATRKPATKKSAARR